MSDVSTPPGQGRYHHGDLRRALLDAAVGILQEGGELSLRAVARRAGVSHAAPYHHFADRRALVAAIALEGLTDFRAALVAAGERESHPLLKLRDIGAAYVGFAVANRAHFRLMFSAELSERDDLPELRGAFEAAYGVLLDAVRTAAGAGAPEEEIRLRATLAWSMVHGLANLILDRQIPGGDTPEEAERLAREVLQRSAPGPPG